MDEECDPKRNLNSSTHRPQNGVLLFTSVTHKNIITSSHRAISNSNKPYPYIKEVSTLDSSKLILIYYISWHRQQFVNL